MARVNSRSAPRMIATNSFWYRSKTLASDFPPTKLARYSTLSLRPRNTVPVWGFVSAERLLRPTVAGSGLRTTILAEQVFISRWLSPRTPGARTPALGAWGPIKVATHRPSTWRIVQFAIAAKDLHLSVVGAALPGRRCPECDRRW